MVDGANVVGSRPDGWWRDRPGAARRLHTRLAALPAAAELVLVLEGAARGGVPEGVLDGVRVVHAPRDGDATVVAETARARKAGRTVHVVTADRELRARVLALGAQVQGPSWLPDPEGDGQP